MGLNRKNLSLTNRTLTTQRFVVSQTGRDSRGRIFFDFKITLANVRDRGKIFVRRNPRITITETANTGSNNTWSLTVTNTAGSPTLLRPGKAISLSARLTLMSTSNEDPTASVSFDVAVKVFNNKTRTQNAIFTLPIVVQPNLGAVQTDVNFDTGKLYGIDEDSVSPVIKMVSNARSRFKIRLFNDTHKITGNGFIFRGFTVKITRKKTNKNIRNNIITISQSRKESKKLEEAILRPKQNFTTEFEINTKELRDKSRAERLEEEYDISILPDTVSFDGGQNFNRFSQSKLIGSASAFAVAQAINVDNISGGGGGGFGDDDFVDGTGEDEDGNQNNNFDGYNNINPCNNIDWGGFATITQEDLNITPPSSPNAPTGVFLDLIELAGNSIEYMGVQFPTVLYSGPIASGGNVPVTQFLPVVYSLQFFADTTFGMVELTSENALPGSHTTSASVPTEIDTFQVNTNAQDIGDEPFAGPLVDYVFPFDINTSSNLSGSDEDQAAAINLGKVFCKTQALIKIGNVVIPEGTPIVIKVRFYAIIPPGQFNSGQTIQSNCFQELIIRDICPTITQNTQIDCTDLQTPYSTVNPDPVVSGGTVQIPLNAQEVATDDDSIVSFSDLGTITNNGDVTITILAFVHQPTFTDLTAQVSPTTHTFNSGTMLNSNFVLDYENVTLFGQYLINYFVSVTVVPPTGLLPVDPPPYTLTCSRRVVVNITEEQVVLDPCIDKTISTVVTNVLPDIMSNTSESYFEGQFTVTNDGGTAPYSTTINGIGVSTMSVSNPATFTGLGAGEYSINVTDADGCKQVASVTVPEVISFDCNEFGPIVSGTAVSESFFGANDGSISITVTQNNTSSVFDFTTTFLWSNGATTQNISDLAPGAYSVTVTITDAVTGEICTDTTTYTVLTGDLPGEEIEPEEEFEDHTVEIENDGGDFGEPHTQEEIELQEDISECLGDFLCDIEYRLDVGKSVKDVYSKVAFLVLSNDILDFDGVVLKVDGVFQNDSSIATLEDLDCIRQRFHNICGCFLDKEETDIGKNIIDAGGIVDNTTAQSQQEQITNVATPPEDTEELFVPEETPAPPGSSAPASAPKPKTTSDTVSPPSAPSETVSQKELDRLYEAVSAAASAAAKFKFIPSSYDRKTIEVEGKKFLDALGKPPSGLAPLIDLLANAAFEYTLKTGLIFPAKN